MKLYLFIMALVLAAAAIANDKQDTVVGRWVVSHEDSAAVKRTVTKDGWYTVRITVPPGARVGDSLLVASVKVRKATVADLQADLAATQSLLWQIKAKLDSSEAKK